FAACLSTEERRDLLVEGREARRQIARWDRDDVFLICEVDPCLDERQQRRQFIGPLPVLGAGAAGQERPGGVQLLAALGGDGRGDALRLVEREAVVQVRPRRELAGRGQAHAVEAVQDRQDALDQRRVAGEEDLGGVLAGVRSGRPV